MTTQGRAPVAQGRQESTAVATAGATPDAAGSALLEVRDLHVRFLSAGRQVHAVRGLSFQVSARGVLAVIGESGSGKTVSARAVMGLLPRTATVSGSARLQGKELVGLSERQMRLHRGRDLAMVFQNPERSLNPTMRIGRQITEAIRTHLDMNKRQADERALELLRLVRIPAPRQRFDEYPHRLSGGMRQRVMIAMALACEPKVLFADEATTALDVTTQAQIMELLADIQDQLGMALVLISHDLGLAASYTNEVVVMYAGRAMEHAPTLELFAHVRVPYTRALLDAVPRLDRDPHSPLPRLEGRPPDLSEDIPGCAFAPRCPRVDNDCRSEAPDLELHDRDHSWACWHPLGDSTETDNGV